MNIWAWDIEIFPDLFTIAFVNCYDLEDVHTLTITSSSSVNDISSFLLEHVQDGDMMVGYNSLSFDHPVLEFALRNSNPTDIHDFAQLCINNQRDAAEELLYKEYRFPKQSFIEKVVKIDLMLIFNKVDRIALKRLAITLNWYWIKELPFPVGSYVAQHAEVVLKYNINDSKITAFTYGEMYDEIKLRFDISRQYNIDVISSSRSVMGAKIMEKLYLDDHPEIRRYQLRDMRTYRQQIDFSDVISDKVRFTTPGLVSLYEELNSLSFRSVNSTVHLTDKDIKFDKKILIGNTVYAMGVGGLHSEHTPEYIRSSDQCLIIDADVASYYPFIMLKEKIYPEHLGEGFLKLFERIVYQRIAAKREGIKITADALKITINSVNLLSLH